MPAPRTDAAAIRQTIRALVAAGHKLASVDDGEEDRTVRTERDAVDAITAVDQAHLYVTLPDGRVGWLFFVLGNDPDEVVCDYTVSLSPVLDPLMQSWWD